MTDRQAWPNRGAAAGIHTTIGPPPDSLGADDEYAIDPVVSTLFGPTLYGPKAAGMWPAGIDLEGPPGAGVIQRVLLANQLVVDAAFNPAPATYVDLTAAAITADFDGSPVRLVLDLASVTNSAAFQGGLQFWFDGAAINPGATQVLGLKNNVAATHVHTDPVAGNTGPSGAIAAATDNLKQSFECSHTPPAGDGTYTVVVRRNNAANVVTLAALFGRMGEFRIERG